MTTETARPEVGQTIYASTIVGRGYEMRPLRVTRVGRRWFYAAPEGASSRAERQFSLDTWFENTYRGRGALALTVDEHAERQERAAAVARLQDTGYGIVGMRHGRSQFDLTTTQLNAIAEIIENGATE